MVSLWMNWGLWDLQLIGFLLGNMTAAWVLLEMGFCWSTYVGGVYDWDVSTLG